MTIDELIAELEEIKKEHGNIEVKIQYRDDGGPADGHGLILYIMCSWQSAAVIARSP